jgi:Septum formation
VTSLAALQAGDPQRVGPQSDKRSTPALPPVPQRTRPRWLWAAVATAVCGVVVAALVVGLGRSGHPAAQPQHTPGPLPSPARPGASPVPTVGNLQVVQMQVGDCLTGANMELNTSNPWPKLTSAVPCSQPHTAEVFFADNDFWPQNISYPGSGAIARDGNAACNSAFRSYIGTDFAKSVFTWTNIIPDALTWPSGDRGLHCIAYYAGRGQPAGATLTGTIRGSRKLVIKTGPSVVWSVTLAGYGPEGARRAGVAGRRRSGPMSGISRMPNMSRSADRAASSPQRPCTPGTGGVADEHR